MRFRKKPVAIDAWPARDILAQSRSNWNELPKAIQIAYERGMLFFVPDSVEIVTLEGTMSAGPLDWIIQGVKGELYPCKPDIFEATYDPVQQETDV
jgi:hypothetical protein